MQKVLSLEIMNRNQFCGTRGDETAYLQVSMQIPSPETYEREFGDLKRIKDNYPKYVISSDPMATSPFNRRFVLS